jgi:CHAT domain-containing protein
MLMTKIKLALSIYLCLLGGFTKADTEQLFQWQYQTSLSQIWPQKTIEHLEASLKNNQHNYTHSVIIRIKLSDLYRVTSEEVKAKEHAKKALDLARKISHNNSLLLAKALNAYGNVLMNSEHFKDYKQAFKRYQEALKLLVPTEQQPQLYANVLTNIAQLWIDVNKYGDKLQKQALYQNDEQIVLRNAIKTLEMALAATRLLPNNHDKAVGFLHLSQIARHIQKELSPDNMQLTLMAYHALEAVRGFDVTVFPRVVSYAYGYLGQLYYAERRYSEALRLTRQALFSAQMVQATDILYLWERQLGQFLLVLGKEEAAINAYQRAVMYLNDIRPSLAKASYRSRQTEFRETVAGKVYLELTELLLQKARNAQNKQLRQSCLSQAQEILEQFKVVELENYFKDDCVGRNKEQDKKNYRPYNCAAHFQKDTVKSLENTAVFYPIIFPDRVELLLHTSEKRVLITVPVNKNDLEDEIENLIVELNQESPTLEQLDELYPPAQQLYNWLIRPIESHITQVETLVVIPDGQLRTIPFAVLHDGKRYLIEKVALATTPSITLTEVRKKWDRTQKTVFLLNGLSEGSQPLFYVEKELKAIEKHYQSEKLLDETFTKDTFRTKLKENAYKVVHIATHGQFEEKPKASFLLTYNDKLKMDDFEQLARWGIFRDRPVELLTLSACEGAMGNERAALGLSGIAVKAGTRSAVASLWQVNDLSTCYLMEAFYRQLKENQAISKAKALQKAQMALLKGTVNKTICSTSPFNNNFKHPYYWAAFLLIGNWL